jgi:hypothetical protein
MSVRATDLSFYAQGASAPTSGALTNGVTYYADLDTREQHKSSVHLMWDAAIIITAITFERTNFSATTAPLSAAASGGNWKDSGVAATAVAGGTADGTLVDFADNIAGRTRIKFVVGGTGGVLTGRACHKGG